MRVRSAVVALLLFAMPAMIFSAPSATDSAAHPPIYIAFLWHMHQPIYYPGETIMQTEAAGHFTFSVTGVHTDRSGPYTTWVRDAIEGFVTAGLPHAGTQVSFTGSLIRNLNALESAGVPAFQNWKSAWHTAAAWRTGIGNPRVDLVGFGYFHPLMGLLDGPDILPQILRHRAALEVSFGSVASKGIFPPENAFSERMIPALVDAGIEWAIVDNIHFDRAAQGYPWSSASNLKEPNGADARNANPNDWLQLSGIWMPSPESATWSRVPHYMEYVDPSSGTATRLIAVPGDRYLGTEDARGGFGALMYQNVMSQLESSNTDPKHPILIVLPHDGDNYGGGSDSYYHGNFNSFIAWLQANPSRFVCTTIQDYLDRFPPDTNDVIHVEDGSWSGADNGDPEFLKWNGGTDSAGYSPDRASWSIVTAARNVLQTALEHDSSNTNVQAATDDLLLSEASDYWYWEPDPVWDSNPARACSLSLALAMPIAQSGADKTPPTIYLPQRTPYNPGGTEWGVSQTADFHVWTLVYDISGLSSVALKWRTSSATAPGSVNMTYAGGIGVSGWTSIPMNPSVVPVKTFPYPSVRAMKYDAIVAGQKNALVDYYVEASDSVGNVSRSPLQHVCVGASGGTGGSNATISWSPVPPSWTDTVKILIRSKKPGWLHWGVDQWVLPDTGYWPAGSTKWPDGKAVESLLPAADTGGIILIRLGPFNHVVQKPQKLAFVVHYADNTWDNNGNKDYFIPLAAATGVKGAGKVPPSFGLQANYPNPFNPTTAVRYTVPVVALSPELVEGSKSSNRSTFQVTIKVYDMLGREVATLVNGVQAPGTYEVTWNAAAMPSGIYFVRMFAGRFVATRKMMLVR